MVRTNGFVGKQKVKDRWEDGGFIVEPQLEDWPVYKVKCLTSDDRQKPKYWILHRNRLLLVTDEDASSIPGQAQAKVTPIVSNATPEAFPEGTGLLEKLLPSLVTQQGGDMTSGVVEWRILHEALDTNGALGFPESSGLDQGGGL